MLVDNRLAHGDIHQLLVLVVILLMEAIRKGHGIKARDSLIKGLVLSTIEWCELCQVGDNIAGKVVKLWRRFTTAVPCGLLIFANKCYCCCAYFIFELKTWTKDYDKKKWHFQEDESRTLARLISEIQVLVFELAIAYEDITSCGRTMDLKYTCKDEYSMWKKKEE